MEIKKNKNPEIMIKEPAGKFVILKIKTPKIAEIAPNKGEKIL